MVVASKLRLYESTEKCLFEGEKKCDLPSLWLVLVESAMKNEVGF